MAYGNSGAWVFVKGTDQNSPTTAVIFERLVTDASGTELAVIAPVPEGGVGAGDAVPSYADLNGQIKSQIVPWLLGDPTNQDRLYLIYSALTAPISSAQHNMNIYCVRLTRQVVGGAELWTAATPVRVNNDSEQQDSQGNFADQWCPAAAVDRLGRVHVIFYDNRVACFNPTSRGAYDVMYALSADGGLTFQNYSLRTCNQRLPLDFALVTPVGQPAGNWSPREYNGIAIDDANTSSTIVWAAYTGTVYNDQTSHASCVYASKVTIANN